MRNPILKALGLITSVALLSALLTVFAPVGTQSASAATGSDFDPGYLVSDENFYNGSAMGFADVQNFILSKNSQCSSSYACLWNYRQATPSMPASAYCAAMPGQSNEPAASIIARVGAACGLSQRALLVILQKEQSLVTSTNPSQRSFTAATGFGCPDTAPCDPSYGGFFYQVYNAARQFQVYRARPTSFNHQPLATNNILFHPAASCGTSPVFILNWATAGLYNYTPYQPNGAALNNLYGTGDGCSAYGNRNFWRMWTDWFGSPTSTPVSVFHLAGTNSNFLISGRMRYPLATEAVSNFGALGPVYEITQSQLDAFRQGDSISRAVRTSDGAAYLIDQGRRLRFGSCGQVQDFGLSCGSLATVTRDQIVGLPDGGWLSSLVALPDGSTWLMQGGQRRETPDPAVLAPYGFTGPPTSVSVAALGGTPIGAPVLGAGVYTDSSGALRIVTNGGSFYASAATVPVLAPLARSLTSASLATISTSGALPIRMSSGSHAFVLVDGGWLEVSAAAYGGGGAFTTLADGAWAGIPLVRVQPNPHFIRERSSPQVSLISGGYRQPVADKATQDWIASSYGVENKVWVTPDGGLDGIVLQIPGLRIVANGGNAYLIDGGARFLFRDCAQVTDFGQRCGSLPTISSIDLTQYRDAGALNNLVKLPDGIVWFIQAGARRETPDPSVLAPYGIPAITTSLPTTTIRSASVGPPVLGPGVFSNGQGAYRAATVGGSFDLSAAATAAIGSGARALTAESFAQFRSDGDLPLLLESGSRRFLLVSGGWLEVSTAVYGAASFTAKPNGAWSASPIVAQRPNPQFVKEASSQQVFLLSGGYRRPVASLTEQNWISATYGVENRVWIAADGALAPVPSIVDTAAQPMVKTSANTYYLIDNGRSFRFSGCPQVQDFGGVCESVPTIPDSQLQGYPSGGALNSLVMLPDGVTWFMQSGQRRETPDPSVLAPYGVPATPTALVSTRLNALPVGSPVLRAGVYSPGDGRTALVTSGGSWKLSTAAMAVQTPTVVRLSSASFDLLGATADLPLRIRAGDRALIAVDGGWLAVDASAYGGTGIFTPMTPDASAGIRLVATVTRPHFVRERSSSQVFLVSGGAIQPVSSQAEQDWISRTYGVENRVWATADGALNGVARR